ncbi:hypothetical protein AEP_01654 [Curvibacter sp. AEP1-3]|uniref:HD domain-containing protein n=1 Tax=Curvibacter sp. AEP1-3 TaxID=1844971 RepID=UPI000B554747|nr:HD domain-containing protein [Curvibacter sp. AEP1-3]ARV18598.1 hypothetical protein AEP_01654 [Curvibacter sp. AEP1-3]
MLTPPRIALCSTPIRFDAEYFHRANAILFWASQGKTRKDGVTPEALHALHVQGLLAQVGVGNPRIHAAALLHDTLENASDDQAVLLRQKIAESLGAQVLAWVDAMTDSAPTGTPRAERKALQLQRMAHAEPEVQCIKLADVVASMEEGPAPGWSPSYAAQYVRQRSQLVGEVLAHNNPALAQRFAEAVAQPVWQAALVQASQQASGV